MVVVGGGLAGTSAALRAVELGKRVLLLEKSEVVPQGGNSMMSVGGFHAAFGSMSDASADIAARVRGETDGEAREALVLAFADNSRRAVRWLVGHEVTLATFPGAAVEFLLPRRAFETSDDWPGSGMAMLLTRLQGDIAARGGIVRRGAAATILIRDDDGGVGGVVVEFDGRLSEVRSTCVVLADGGFQASPALLRAHVGPAADQALLRGGRGDTGDAMTMAVDAGAKTVGLAHVYAHLLHRDALENHRLWPYPMLDDLITSAGDLVDRRGNAVTHDGGVSAANALARGNDPRGAWIVIGEAAFEAVGASGPHGLALPAPVELRRRGGSVQRAESPAELAGLLGMTDGVLESTLTGRAPGALLGIPVVPGITYTMGGPLVDGRMRVLDDDERPIRGLYAAGSTLGGLEGGPRGGYIGGLAPALVTGLIAGEQTPEATGADS